MLSLPLSDLPHLQQASLLTKAVMPEMSSPSPVPWTGRLQVIPIHGELELERAECPHLIRRCLDPDGKPFEMRRVVRWEGGGQVELTKAVALLRR